MLTFDASEFYRATANLRGIQGVVTNIERYDQKLENKVTDGDAELVRQHLEAAKEHFETLSVRVTAMATDELIYELRTGVTYQGLKDGLDDIDKTLRRELRLTKLLVLDRSEERYFDPEEPLFGWEVDMFFPGAAYEVDEASKCMALGRYTATVFHLMRLLESALAAVGRCLEIPDPVKEAERNWGIMLDKIKTEMDRRSKDANAGWPDPADKVLFREIYVSLDAVRVAWRNATMHVESKYTYEEAEHIFGAVRGLMRKVSHRMTEDGEPKVSEGTLDQNELEFETAADAAAAAADAEAAAGGWEVISEEPDSERAKRPQD